MSDSFFLSPIGKAIWEDRYALKDKNGKLIESDIYETFERVSKAIASKEKDPTYWGKRFYDILARKEFCPAGRILAHSGTHYSQLLNCFVLPFRDDSLEEIMHTASDASITHKYGGGTGFNYSTLRPDGSYIKGVNGRSCGVIGFLSMMSSISEVIEQGGSRRSANLGLLEVSHPDIWEFISYKTDHNWDRMLEFIDIRDRDKWELFKFENLYKWQMYNVSVGITDMFLNAVSKDDEWIFKWGDNEWKLYTVEFEKVQDNKSLITRFETMADSDETALWKARKKVPYPTPRDKFSVVSKRRVKAREIWDKICYNAWADGCPGLINISRAKEMHNLEYARPLLAANPCAEQMLPGHSCCLLGSLILSTFVNKENKTFDFHKLEDSVRTAVRFMDDVIDNCDFPLPEMRDAELSERRIGLGTMGVHDMLIELELDYDTDEGRNLVEMVLERIRDVSYVESTKLAEEKGSFPLYDKKKYTKSGFIKTLPDDVKSMIMLRGIRNSLILSEAPTGTIGTMYGVSTGCEPWYALSFQRNSRLGSYEDGCRKYIEWKKNNPESEKPGYFKTSQEISYLDHIKMMIVFSKYIDSSVSKTINLPNNATVDDVKSAFLYAMDNGVKGVTVFRDGCKQAVLVNKDVKEEPPEEILNDLDKSDLSMKRGNRTMGATTRIHMQGHNMYVTVNKNKCSKMVEVFATVGESKLANATRTSGVEDSWAEGLGKTISLALRAGVAPDAIIRNLKNIPSDKPVFTTIGDCERSEVIPSPVHAIARVMEEEISYELPKHVRKEIPVINGACKKCGSTNLEPNGPNCFRCRDCGTSGCEG